MGTPWGKVNIFGTNCQENNRILKFGPENWGAGQVDAFVWFKKGQERGAALVLPLDPGFLSAAFLPVGSMPATDNVPRLSSLCR